MSFEHGHRNLDEALPFTDMKNFRLIPLVAAALGGIMMLASGCELLGLPTGSGRSDLREVSGDGPFEIEVGQQVLLTDFDVEVRFVEVGGDGRCPRNLMCVWAGMFRTTFELMDRRQSHPFEISGYLGEEVQEEGLVVEVGGFRVEMKALAPYPVYDPDTGRSTSGRVALLEVHRISGR